MNSEYVTLEKTEYGIEASIDTEQKLKDIVVDKYKRLHCLEDILNRNGNWGTGASDATAELLNSGTTHFLTDAFDTEEEYEEAAEDLFLDIEFSSVADNTYNIENDLTKDFIYSFVYPEEEDYLYNDEVILLITRHIGGDPRGNYKATEAYYIDRNELLEDGFFDLQIRFFNDDKDIDFEGSWNLDEPETHDFDKFDIVDDELVGVNTAPAVVLDYY